MIKIVLKGKKLDNQKKYVCATKSNCVLMVKYDESDAVTENFIIEEEKRKYIFNPLKEKKMLLKNGTINLTDPEIEIVDEFEANVYDLLDKTKSFSFILDANENETHFTNIEFEKELIYELTCIIEECDIDFKEIIGNDLQLSIKNTILLEENVFIEQLYFERKINNLDDNQKNFLKK